MDTVQGGAEVFDYLYMAGVIHLARRNVLEQIGAARQHQQEEEEMLEHCTFTPCLGLRRRRNRDITKAPHLQIAATPPRDDSTLERPSDDAGRKTSTPAAAEWGSPSVPCGVPSRVDPLTDRPMVPQPDPKRGRAAAARLYEDLFRRQRLALQREQEKCRIEAAAAESCIGPPPVPIQGRKTHVDQSGDLRKPPENPHYARPLTRACSANLSAAPERREPPRTRPVDVAAWKKRARALELAQPTKEQVASMVEKARERQALRHAKQAAGAVVDQMAMTVTPRSRSRSPAAARLSPLPREDAASLVPKLRLVELQ